MWGLDGNNVANGTVARGVQWRPQVCLIPLFLLWSSLNNLSCKKEGDNRLGSNKKLGCNLGEVAMCGRQNLWDFNNNSCARRH